MNTTKTILSLSLALGAMVWVNGCGGGSDTTTTAAATTIDTTSSVSGIVADGYLVGAKVCLDQNRNDACDVGEPMSLTDAAGRYTFTISDAAAVAFPILVEADETTIDLDTNTPIGEKWHFKAMTGQGSFISPLSTLVAQAMELNPALTLTQAMTDLQTELGLSDISISEDYVAKNNLQAHNTAKIIAKSLANTQTVLSTSAPAVEPRLIRLLAAKQVRSQTSNIKTHAQINDTTFVSDVNTTDVAGQITALSASLASALTPQLQADLLFMWEEERLARDVYNVLYAKWGSKIFSNIATNGEETHINSTKSMIDKYAVNTTGYAQPDIPGIFVNQDLQALYNTLIAQGSVSVTEGYKVGVLIEVTDIEDLTKRLLPTDLPSDIRAVYEALRSGSENHLAAFNKQL